MDASEAQAAAQDSAADNHVREHLYGAPEEQLQDGLARNSYGMGLPKKREDRKGPPLQGCSRRGRKGINLVDFVSLRSKTSLVKG